MVITLVNAALLGSFLRSLMSSNGGTDPAKTHAAATAAVEPAARLIGPTTTDQLPDALGTTHGDTRLFHNAGDGTFVDVTDAADCHSASALPQQRGPTTTATACSISTVREGVSQRLLRTPVAVDLEDATARLA